MPRTVSKRYLETQQCELPDRLDEPIAEPWFDDADPSVPKSPEPREPISARQTCIAIMQSGPNKGQACGKPVVHDFLCRRHAEQAAAKDAKESGGDRPVKRTKIEEPTAGRCVCKTKKGEYCGAVVKGGGLVCKRHANCPIPPEVADQLAQPVVAVEAQEPLVIPEVIAPPVSEAEVEMTTRDEVEPVLVLPPESEAEPEPLAEIDLLQQPEWSTQRVSNDSEMMKILRKFIVVNVDERQLELLEQKIRACFQ